MNVKLTLALFYVQQERSSAWRSKDAPPREDRFRDAPRDRDRGEREGGFRDRDRDRFAPRRDER